MSIPLPCFLSTDVGMTKFFRLNDEKVLKWLCLKVRLHPSQAHVLGGFFCSETMCCDDHVLAFRVKIITFWKLEVQEFL